MRQIFGELDRDRRIFEAEARRIASGHHRGARWRAGRVRGIGGGEIDAFACKRVDVRRLDDPRDAAAVEADIVIAEVVGAEQDDRSEERRVGKEGVRTCNYWWSPYH